MTALREDLLAVNPDCKVTKSQVGNGKHSVVIIDNFYKYPDEIAALANSLCYTNEPMLLGNYPGFRAFVSLDDDEAMAKMSEAWGKKLSFFMPFSPTTFSVIQQTPETVLNWGQRQPHLDPGITALIYLNEEKDCHGGTALYRHKISGLERVPTQVTPELMELAARNGIHPQKLQEPDGLKAFEESYVLNPLFALRENRYPNDGTEFWEMICLIKMHYNRLVIFDGRMPHSMHLSLKKYHEIPRLSQIMYLKDA